MEEKKWTKLDDLLAYLETRKGKPMEFKMCPKHNESYKTCPCYNKAT